MVTKKVFFLSPLLSIIFLIIFTTSLSACSIATPTINIDFNLPINLVESKNYTVSGKTLKINEYRLADIETTWNQLQKSTNNYLPPFEITKPYIEDWLNTGDIYSLDIHKPSKDRMTILQKNNSDPFNCVYPQYSYEGDWIVTTYKQRPYCVTVGAPGSCGKKIVHPFLYLRFLLFKK